MNKQFAQLAAILLAATIGYSILSTPGRSFDIDVYKFKNVLLYVLFGLSAYAIYVTFRPPRRPPGV